MRRFLLVLIAACLTACATQTICDYVTCIEGEGGAGGDAADGGGGSS